MLETPHVAVGAAIATHFPNPLVAIPLAFTSHFVLEKVPHWNPHLNTELRKYGKITRKSTLIVILDVLLSLFLGFFVASTTLPDTTHFGVIITACFASVLPDVIEGPYFFLKMKNKFIEKWIAFQKSVQTDTTFVPGILTQIVTTIAALVWIFN